jgi:hypothetical protein
MSTQTLDFATATPSDPSRLDWKGRLPAFPNDPLRPITIAEEQGTWVGRDADGVEVDPI